MRQGLLGGGCSRIRLLHSACAPLCCKICAVRPVFGGVVGELRAEDPSNVQGPVKQNASPGEQSEAPRPRWKPGQEQNAGPESQDSQHMLEQPRGHLSETPENPRILRKSTATRVARKGVPAHVCNYGEVSVGRGFNLVAPYHAIFQYRCDTPYRAIPLQRGSHSSKMVRHPPPCPHGI